ncbi:35419_t:CDS:2, partial [Gigaspora margarita]
NTSRNLKIYSVIVNIIVTILIAKYLAEIIYIIVNRQSYLDDCITSWVNKSSDPKDLCVNSYNITLVTEIIGDLIETIILIYFAMVIASYAVSRKEKEMRKSENNGNGENRPENNENNTEGPLNKILETVQKCIAKLHDSNIPRLDTTLRIQSRTDKKMGIDERFGLRFT